MKFEITYTHQFKKSLKRLTRSGRFDIEKYYRIVDLLAHREILPHSNHDHPLVGDYAGYRECHIESDVLLIYKVKEDLGVISLSDIGSHTYLFGM